MEPVVHHYVRNSLLTILSFSVVGGIGYLGHQNYQLTKSKILLSGELAQTKQEVASTTQALANKVETLNKLASDMDAVTQLLTVTQGDKFTAEQDILRQKELVDSMNAQVAGMATTLSLYKKIISTDRELLAKYSRVYFLNENYTPKYSVIIPTFYTYNPEKEEMLSVDVWPFLKNLLDDAQAASTDIKIISAFRSFDTQSSLKSAYKITYGTGSNKFSADQGYSEHQLGTTIDFTTSKLGAVFSTFAKTAEYSWLTENAYKYGFILSYPKNNTYYIFEPWHWRFVGKALALRLHNENKNFYDLSQRDIDEYLGTLFDK